MLLSDGINHNKLQSIIVGELKKAGLKHRLKKIIQKNVKVSKVRHFRSGVTCISTNLSMAVTIYVV